jgi:hypothetical protein
LFWYRPLDRVGWFGNDVVWLGPHDEAPFRAFAELAFAAFPSCAPYGGRYAGISIAGNRGPLWGNMK